MIRVTFRLVKRFYLLIFIFIVCNLRFGLGLRQFGYIARPDIPVLFCIVDFAIRRLVIFLVYNVIECFTNPIEMGFLLLRFRLHGCIQGLEAGYNPHKSRKWNHGHQRFCLMVSWLGEEHQWRRNQMLRSQHIM